MNFINNIYKRIIEDLKNIWPALLVLAIYAFFTQIFFGTVCPFRIVTHVKCPGCGLTHACLLIMAGRFREAASWNISGFLWFPYLFLLLFWRYILNKKFPLALPGAVICSIASLLQWFIFLQEYLHYYLKDFY